MPNLQIGNFARLHKTPQLSHWARRCFAQLEYVQQFAHAHDCKRMRMCPAGTRFFEPMSRFYDSLLRR